MADQGGATIPEPLAARPEPVKPKPRPFDARGALGVMLLYIAVVFIVAAVAAPWLYNAAQRFAPESYLADQPFHRYVNRLILFFSLLGLVPLARELGLKFSLTELGLRKRHAADIPAGFLWSFGILALITALSLAFGARAPDLAHSAGEWAKHLKNAALAAVIAGTLEELLFRGGLFGGLRRRDAFFPAALTSSLIYGIVHFFERPSNPEYVQWNSGLLMLSQMLRGFFDLHALVPGLLNLTLVGMILCLAYERRQSLFFSIGLHAGLIFWIKSSTFLTGRTLEGNSWIWGGDKLVDGWAGFAVLSIGYFLLWRTVKGVSHEPPRLD